MSGTIHPCTFPHILGYARPTPEPEPDNGLDDYTTEEIDQLANLEFDAWEERNCSLPTNEQWISGINTYLLTLRLAAQIVCKSKPQVIEGISACSARSDGGELLSRFLDDLRKAEDLFESFANLAKCAESRLLCGTAVVVQRDAAGLA